MKASLTTTNGTGTTILFAALDLLDGSFLAQCKPRHRHEEFLAFLRHLEADVPAKLDIHLVVGNYVPIRARLCAGPGALAPVDVATRLCGAKRRPYAWTRLRRIG